MMHEILDELMEHIPPGFIPRIINPGLTYCSLFNHTYLRPDIVAMEAYRYG